MSATLADLVDVLELERLDTNLFRGQSRDIGTNRVFGGQVLGQAMSAANQTVEGRAVHSLHAYFLHKGDHTAPIIYEVDRQRDGRSFSSRRVVAIQHGRPIFNFAASFQAPEDGLEHQATAPEVPPPDQLEDVRVYRRRLIEKIPVEQLPRYLLHERPFEFRPVQTPQFVDPAPREPVAQVWFRADGRLGDDPNLHRSVLAYVSDYYLLATATRPHGFSLLSPGLQMASLDHAMWFHRPFRADEWLLYALESPNSSGARGLARGMIFREDGALVATVAQEGVMRWIGPARG
jgi:acyl-CoA thioesterase-2